MNLSDDVESDVEEKSLRKHSVSWIASLNFFNKTKTKNTRNCVSLLTAIIIVLLVIIITFIFIMSYRNGDTADIQLRIAQLTTHAEKVKAMIDKTEDPCSDFYIYSCGNWINNTTLPAGHSRWSYSFDRIAEENAITVQKILEDDWPIIGKFYKTCLSETECVDGGFSEIAQIVDSFKVIETREELLQLLKEIRFEFGIQTSFLFDIVQDIDLYNSSQYVFSFTQNGIILPFRDYYLNPASVNFDTQIYKNWIRSVFESANISISNRSVDAIYTFELNLANITKSFEAVRLELGNTQVKTSSEIRNLIGEFLFNYSQNYIPVEFKPNSYIFGQPEYFTNLSIVVNNTDFDVLRNYALLRFLKGVYPHLGYRYSNITQLFNSITNGKNMELQNRTIFCRSLTTNLFPDLVGRYFVERTFKNETVTEIREILDKIVESFHELIFSSTWMDDVTRAEALMKLELMDIQIGYPETWINYYELLQNYSIQIDNNHITNYRLISKMNDIETLKSSLKPVDKKTWYFNPTTVNAGYMPNFNQVTFPAGILQDPFYSLTNAIPSNFGALGTVFGHEYTHAFDDQGSRFDATGIMRDWWTATARQTFNDRALCISDYYSQLQVSDSVFVNGILTLGENIADMGGLHETYDAFITWSETEDAQLELDLIAKIYSLSAKELFFISFAQSWCEISTQQYEQELVLTDPHSPSKFRVQGTLSNFPAFAETFGCESGNIYAPEDVCQIW